MAIIISPDGTVTRAPKPENGTDYVLDELCKHSGSEFVEMVSLQSEQIMFIDEHGKFKGKPRNARASDLLYLADGSIHDYIAGDAFICGQNEVL